MDVHRQPDVVHTAHGARQRVHEPDGVGRQAETREVGADPQLAVPGGPGLAHPDEVDHVRVRQHERLDGPSVPHLLRGGLRERHDGVGAGDQGVELLGVGGVVGAATGRSGGSR